MPNVDLARKSRISPFRKIALGTWQTAYDPSIYGTLRVRADAMLDYIERFREKTGKKLTMTHIVGKTIGLALTACPEANSILRFNGLYQRNTVDVSFLVFMEHDGKKDLSSAKVRDVDEKTLLQIVDELEGKALAIRERKDKELETTRQSMRLIPALAMNWFLKTLSFLLYSLNLDLRWAGLPKDAFGSAIVTSIGSIGLEVGYVPLVPYTRVPIFVAPGEVRAVPVVESGRVEVGHEISLNVTFDHRIIDGSHAAQLAEVVRRVFEDPFSSLDPVD